MNRTPIWIALVITSAAGGNLETDHNLTRWALTGSCYGIGTTTETLLGLPSAVGRGHQLPFNLVDLRLQGIELVDLRTQLPMKLAQASNHVRVA